LIFPEFGAVSLSHPGDESMTEKLYTGDAFPELTLKLANGGTFNIPASVDSKYLIAIFYRGHW